MSPPLLPSLPASILCLSAFPSLCLTPCLTLPVSLSLCISPSQPQPHPRRLSLQVAADEIFTYGEWPYDTLNHPNSGGQNSLHPPQVVQLARRTLVRNQSLLIAMQLFHSIHRSLTSALQDRCPPASWTDLAPPLSSLNAREATGAGPWATTNSSRKPY